MSKDPMLRGNPAPAGFASSVSGWIQAYVAEERLRNPSASMNTRARLNTIDGCSSAPVAAGDEDPRIRTLALASPGARWNPGAQASAVIHGTGHKPGSLWGEPNEALTGEKMLDALAFGAVLDMQTAQQRELSQIRKGPEAAPLQTALLHEERERADGAERRNRELTIQLASSNENYVNERDLRRQYQAILQSTGRLPADSNGGETAAAAEPKRERLPAGVRKRGDGYQAYWRGATGKQQQQGGFTTAADAKAHRDVEMEKVSQAKVKARNVMPEVSADRGVEQVQAEYGEMVKAGLA